HRTLTQADDAPRRHDMERTHMTTTTDSQAPAAQAAGATGRVARVTGAVVDIEFPPGNIPELYNALTIEIEDTGSGLAASTLTLETAQHLGDGMEIGRASCRGRG